MPIKRIKNFLTPEGRQYQITDYFKSTGTPINRRLFVDNSLRTDMHKKHINAGDSENEFVGMTPNRRIQLPYPIISDDEEEDISTPKNDVENTKKCRGKNSKKKKLGSSTKSNKGISKRTGHKGKKIDFTRNSKTPKTSDRNALADGDSSDIECFESPSKRIKVDSTSECGNLKINVQISLPSIFTPNTPESSKILNKINSASPVLATPCSSKSKTTSPKSTSGKKTLTPKKFNKSMENTPRTEKIQQSASPKARRSLKLEEEDFKLNFKQMEMLKKIFTDTLDDANMRNLITSKEIDYIKGFLSMEVDYQYFLVKLFIYQPLWYNVRKFCGMIKLDQKLCSKDISNMYEYHKNKFYVDTDISNLTTLELLNMLLLPDLKQIVKDLKLRSDKKVKTKADHIQLLCRNSKTQCTLTMKKSSADILKDVALKHLGHCVRLKEDVRSSFQKAYILQTYSNSSYYTDIQNYFKDIGYLGVAYPNYTVEKFTPFKTPEQFSRFYEAVSMKIELQGAFEKKDLAAAKQICDQAFEKLKNVDDDAKWKNHLPGYLHKFSGEYVYISILKSSIKKMNKNCGDVKIWLEYLIEKYPKNHAVGFWYKHLAHILSHYHKNHETAAEILIKAYEFDKKENIFDFLQVFELNKLANKLRTTKSYKLCNLYCDQLAVLSELPVDLEDFPKKFIKACTDRRETPAKRIYSFRDANNEVSYGSVEMIALKHYSSNEQYQGLHCEGQLMVLLFTLFFWDIIYEYYVPMTFISKLQIAPLDMYSHSFYENRRDEIEKRLEEISTEWSYEKLDQTLRDNWINHSHEKSIVDFENLKMDIDGILKIIRCFNRAVLSKILGRLATNYRRFRSGLPDLFLWNLEDSKCKFVEVKGENDKLQPNQVLWIQYLLEVGAVVEICHVSGVGAKKNLSEEKNNKVTHNEEEAE